MPAFDRTSEATNWTASVCTPQQQIVITEGNYLLLDEEPWSGLRGLFDLTVWINVPQEHLERRILQRWSRFGLDEQQARERWRTNDGPNAAHTTAFSRQADVMLEDD